MEQQGHGLASSFSRAFPVAAGAMLLGLAITTVAIWARRAALTGRHELNRKPTSPIASPDTWKEP